MHKILVTGLYFQYMLYIFRTILVHLQEQSFISCVSRFGICRYHSCCVAIATQQPDVWYRHIPNAMYSL